jgi:hypothetical protein
MRNEKVRGAARTLLLVASLAGDALAAEPETLAAGETNARAYFNAGARAYTSGKYPEAIRAFEEAYRIEPRPGLLFSVAQAYRRQYFIDRRPENLRRAVLHYRRYLESEPEGNRRGDSAQALSELEPFLSRLPEGDDRGAEPPAAKPLTQLMISSPVDEVAISLDGTAAGTLPYIAPVEPGEHRVVLTAAGYRPFERSIRVLAGSVVPLDVALEEEPARLEVEAARGARVAVDGRPRGETPMPVLEIAPGRHLVAVTANGHEPYTREIVLRRAQAARLSVTLPPSGQRTTAWVVIGCGGAAMLAGGGLLGTAVVREQQANDMLSRRDRGELTVAGVEQYQRDRAARDDLRMAGFITAGAGALLTGIGLFLYAFDEPRPPSFVQEREQPKKPSVTPRGLDVSAVPVDLPGGAGAALRGTF